MAQDFSKAFFSAEQEYGLPEGYLGRVSQVESGGDPFARNPNSSATGLFQFTDSTAAEFDVNPLDPNSSITGAAKLAARNRADLRKRLGREPTDAELYLAHQQGAAGAAALLNDSDKFAVDVLEDLYGNRDVAEKALLNNGGNLDLSAGDFANSITKKYSDASFSYPTGSDTSALEGMALYRAMVSDADSNAQDTFVDAMGIGEEGDPFALYGRRLAEDSNRVDAISAPDGYGEVFERGFDMGVEGMQSDLQMFMALGNQLIGNTEDRDYRLSRAEAYSDRATNIGAPLQTVGEFFDNPTVEGALEQIFSLSGQMAPTAMQIFASALVTGGSGAIAGALGKGVATSAAKKAATKIVSEVVEKSLKKKALDAAEKMVLNGAFAAAKTGFKRGAYAGAFGGEYPLMAGASFREFEEAGVEQTPYTALAAGLIGAAVTVPSVAGEIAIVKGAAALARRKAASEIAATGKKGIFSEFASLLGKGVVKGSVVEGSTEGIQEGGLVAQRLLIDDDYSAEEAYTRIGEALFAGAVGGGVFSGGLSVPGAAVGAIRNGASPTSDVFTKARDMLRRKNDASAEVRVDAAAAGVNDGIYNGDSAPESSRDLGAQLNEVLDDSSPKQAMWLEESNSDFAIETPDGAVISGETARANPQTVQQQGELFFGYVPGRGVIISKKASVVQAVIESKNLEDSLRHYLGFTPREKDDTRENDTHAVRVFNPQGDLVHEETTNEALLDKSQESAARFINNREGYTTDVVPIQQALEERRQRFDKDAVRNVEFDDDGEPVGEGPETGVPVTQQTQEVSELDNFETAPKDETEAAYAPMAQSHWTKLRVSSLSKDSEASSGYQTYLDKLEQAAQALYSEEAADRLRELAGVASDSFLNRVIAESSLYDIDFVQGGRGLTVLRRPKTGALPSAQRALLRELEKTAVHNKTLDVTKTPWSIQRVDSNGDVIEQIPLKNLFTIFKAGMAFLLASKDAGRSELPVGESPTTLQFAAQSFMQGLSELAALGYEVVPNKTVLAIPSSVKADTIFDLMDRRLIKNTNLTSVFDSVVANVFDKDKTKLGDILVSEPIKRPLDAQSARSAARAEHVVRKRAASIMRSVMEAINQATGINKADIAAVDTAFRLLAQASPAATKALEKILANAKYKVANKRGKGKATLRDYMQEISEQLAVFVEGPARGNGPSESSKNDYTPLDEYEQMAISAALRQMPSAFKGALEDSTSFSVQYVPDEYLSAPLDVQVNWIQKHLPKIYKRITERMDKLGIGSVKAYKQIMEESSPTHKSLDSIVEIKRPEADFAFLSDLTGGIGVAQNVGNSRIVIETGRISEDPNKGGYKNPERPNENERYHKFRVWRANKPVSHEGKMSQLKALVKSAVGSLSNSMIQIYDRTTTNQYVVLVASVANKMLGLNTPTVIYNITDIEKIIGEIDKTIPKAEVDAAINRLKEGPVTEELVDEVLEGLFGERDMGHDAGGFVNRVPTNVRWSLIYATFNEALRRFADQEERLFRSILEADPKLSQEYFNAQYELSKLRNKLEEQIEERDAKKSQKAVEKAEREIKYTEQNISRAESRIASIKETINKRSKAKAEATAPATEADANRVLLEKFGTTNPHEFALMAVLQKLDSMKSFGVTVTDHPLAHMRPHLVQALNDQAEGTFKARAIIGDNLNVVIVNDLKLSPAQQAAAVGHELGHVLFKEEYKTLFKKNRPLFDKLMAEFQKVKNTEKTYQEEHGFEEWYSDQVAASFLQQVSVIAKSRGRADIDSLTPQEKGRRIVVSNYFKKIAEKLVSFYNEIAKIFGRNRLKLNETFKQYMDAVGDAHRRNNRISNDIGVEGKYLIRNLTETLKGAIPQKAVDIIKEQTDRIMRSGGMKLFRKYFTTAHNYLSKEFGTYGEELADFFLRDSNTGVGSGRGWHQDVIYHKNRYTNKFFKIFGIALHTDTNVLESDEVRTVLELAEDNTVSTNELLERGDELGKKAFEVRKLFEEIYSEYIRPVMGKKIGRLPDFYTRMLDIVKIIENPEEFRKFLIEEVGMTELEAKVLLDGDGDTWGGLLNQGTDAGAFVPEYAEFTNDEEKLAWFKANEPIKFKWISKRAKDNEITLVEAMNVIEEEQAANLQPGIPTSFSRTMKDVNTKILRRAREGDKDGWLVPPGLAVIQYFHSLTRRVEYERRGGIEAVMGMLKDIEGEMGPEARAEAEDIISGILGKKGAGLSSGWRTFNAISTTHTIITLLMFTSLSSLPDITGIALRSREFGNIKAAWDDITAMGWEEAKAFAADVGVATHEALDNMLISVGELDYTNSTARRITSSFFKWTGLRMWTRFTRVLAASAGRSFILRLADADLNHERTGKRDTRYLEELDLTQREIRAWRKSGFNLNTKEGKKISRAVHQFAEEAIIRPSAAERPSWANDPRLQFIWSLKSYFYSWGKVVLGGAGREIQNRHREDGNFVGGAQLLLLGGLFMLPLAMLGMEIREWLRYMGRAVLPGVDADGTVFRTDRMGGIEYIFEMLERGGVFGPWSLAISTMDAISFDGPLGVLSANVPSFDAAMDLVGKGNLNRTLPVVNNIYSGEGFWNIVPLDGK